MTAILEALNTIVDVIVNVYDFLQFSIEYIIGAITIPLTLIPVVPAVFSAALLIGLVILIIQVVV